MRLILEVLRYSHWVYFLVNQDLQYKGTPWVFWIFKFDERLAQLVLLNTALDSQHTNKSSSY